MKYSFKIAAEYFDRQDDAHQASGGSFNTLTYAARAVKWIDRYLQTDPGKRKGIIPDELEEVAAIYDTGGTLEIVLYAQFPDGREEWLVSFNAFTKEPFEVTPDAELLWPIIKKGLSQ